MTLDGALNEKDIETLRAIPEHYMVLPGLDDHGRVVIMADKTRLDFKKHDRNAIVSADTSINDAAQRLYNPAPCFQTRLLWYQFHIALENEAAQKKGIVGIGVMRIMHLGHMDRRLQVMTFKSINQAIPIKLASAHLCHVPAFFSVVWPVLAFVMGSKIRQRCFIRKGSEEQVLHELKKFGIPARMLPKTHMGGEWELDIEEWMTARRRVEHGEKSDNSEKSAAEFTKGAEEE